MIHWYIHIYSQLDIFARITHGIAFAQHETEKYRNSRIFLLAPLNWKADWAVWTLKRRVSTKSAGTGTGTMMHYILIYKIMRRIRSPDPINTIKDLICLCALYGRILRMTVKRYPEHSKKSNRRIDEIYFGGGSGEYRHWFEWRSKSPSCWSG